MTGERENFDWKKYLNECLGMTEYCCIATIDDYGTWSNPVYFAWDENFNLYFISQPNSRHMQNLKKDSRISVAIYSTAQDTFGDVIGVQLHGKCIFLTNREDVAKARAIYHGRRYGTRGKPIPDANEDEYTNNPEWVFVKVEPAQIYYFDTRFFGEERQEVPKAIFKS